MLKLSDYLDYLNKEIIQARMQADINSVELAKLYAKHEYLQFFKVPRFQMHNIKLDIPVKITQINDDPEYELDITKPDIVDRINEAIKLSNDKKKLGIPAFHRDSLRKDDFKPIIDNVKGDIGRVIFTESKRPDIKPIIKDIRSKQEAKLTPDQASEMQRIIREICIKERRVVQSNLKDIFIDPNTGTEGDKGKILVNLHVELVEEGIRLVQVKDKDGKVIEQITVD